MPNSACFERHVNLRVWQLVKNTQDNGGAATIDFDQESRMTFCVVFKYLISSYAGVAGLSQRVLLGVVGGDFAFHGIVPLNYHMAGIDLQGKLSDKCLRRQPQL